MRKQVNGKFVNIGDIELFIQAAEGTVLDRKASNSVVPGIDVINKLTKDIALYTKFNSLLPFPLCAIDKDIKYTMIGECIRIIDKKSNIFVREGLNIQLKENTYVKFVNNTWGIVEIEDKNIRKWIGLSGYKKETGYREFKWIFDTLLSGGDTQDFYKVFFDGLLEICNNDYEKLKKELRGILSIKEVPEKMEFRQNRILNINEDEEYILNIYKQSERTKESSIYRFTLDDEEVKEELRSHKVDVYGYSIYKIDQNDRDKSNNKHIGNLESIIVYGTMGLFNMLCAIKSITPDRRFPDYKGVIIRDNLIFEINGRVFQTKAFKYEDMEEIATNMSIYHVNKAGLVYLNNDTKIGNGIIRRDIYSYIPGMQRLMLSKVMFVRE